MDSRDAAFSKPTIGNQLTIPADGQPQAAAVRVGADEPEPEPPELPQGGAPFEPPPQDTPAADGGLLVGLGALGLLWAQRKVMRRRR